LTRNVERITSGGVLAFRRPIRLRRHRNETVVGDEAQRQLGAQHVELVRPVRRLAEQDEATFGCALEERFEALAERQRSHAQVVTRASRRKTARELSKLDPPAVVWI